MINENVKIISKRDIMNLFNYKIILDTKDKVILHEAIINKNDIVLKFKSVETDKFIIKYFSNEIEFIKYINKCKIEI